MNPSQQIAFLGLGAMGRRMASRLAAAGHALRVWSRSGVPDDAPTLRAHAAPTVRAAVEGAAIVFAMVTDDDASRALWTGPDGALAAASEGALLVECSTLTPAWVSELAAAAGARGLRLLDAPVVGSRPQAEAGALTFLAGGDVEDVARATPTLTAMGGAVQHLGPTAAGASAKLVVNALFGVQVAALAELLGYAERAGLDLAALSRALEGSPVTSPAAKGALGLMRAGRHAPMFPIDLLRKDLRYVSQTAAASGGELPVTHRAGEVYARAAEGGLGGENLTAVAKLYAASEAARPC
ncbi:MAG: NAD(P)-dependent oxidoreductase [Polyangiales bacterium]